MNTDMTTVNPAIKRTRHVTPTTDELKYILNGSQHFTKLDMKQGYVQFELHEDSRHLNYFFIHTRDLEEQKHSCGSGDLP